MKRWLLGLAVAAGIASGPAPARAAPPAPEAAKVRVALGWTVNASQLLFVYGVEKGYYRAEGLDVSLDSGAGAGVAIQRVVSGAYDFGYADIGTLVRHDAEHRDRPAVAVYVAEDESPLALFTLQGSGIARPKDIEGRRLGVSQFDGARLMLPVLAQANGIDLSTVGTKTVDAQLREVMLVRKEVDVITGFTSTSVPLLTSLGQKFTVLRYRDFGVQGAGQAIVATPTFVAAHPETVRAFVRATNLALKDMVRHPDEALAVLKKANPLVDLQAERLRLDLIVHELVLTPNVARNGLSHGDAQRLGRIVDDVLASTANRQPLAAGTVYDERFLPPAPQRSMAADAR